MRAILQTAYGDPETVLVPGRLDVPTPGPGEVLVQVRATSVNTPDWIATLGMPYLLRPLVLGLTRPVSAVRGSDLAGVVEAVGDGVVDLVPGDAVFGSVWTPGGFSRGGHGTFRAHTVAPAGQLAKIPPGLGFAEAAGAVMSGVTALQALRDVAKLAPGERLLVNGASGGLGTFAVQIGRAMGAEVTGVCGPSNVDLVRSLGATHVLDHTREDYTKGEARYDVILDNVLNHPPAATASVLAPGGRFVPNSIGGNRWVGSLPQMASMGLFRPEGWSTVEYRPERAHLEALAGLLASGAVRVVIDRRFPLEQAGAAVAYMAGRHARGKVVIEVDDAPGAGAASG